ncbi:MAG: radical SAM protein [Candidatus Bathyarchaeia archaeon]
MFSEVFYGKNTDPGMSGSLLYHMAMITKMATENRFLIEELKVEAPNITEHLTTLYNEFASDANTLIQNIGLAKVDPEVAKKMVLSTTDKITLFEQLIGKTRIVAANLEERTLDTVELMKLFDNWANYVAEMRLRQEYETIKGLLTTAELARTLGLPRLQAAMNRVQNKFGEETVSIALDVTLKVGLRREKLQTIMLSDHFINYKMDMAKLDGRMEFLNCPVYGSHKYVAEKMGIPNAVTTLFCTHFCYAHAKAMLEAVLPFPFALQHPQHMATNGKCEFYLQLGAPSMATTKRKFVPLVLSWNITRKCNLKCSHCYINATKQELHNELNTEEAKMLIDQICEVSRPLLILSGGEPLLRQDVFELIRYGTEKGLRMGLGSNGTLIDKPTAVKLKEAGVKTVSISLDSSNAKNHDEFRGVEGSWEKAVRAITALKESGVLVQVNTTVTQQNYGEIDEIMSLSEKLGVENFHLFFLVPTGRGVKLADMTADRYEDMIKIVFEKAAKHRLNVRPSCAPQFMRIAKDRGLDMRQWIRGCIAGLYYCRVYPTGDVTPCPYLPVKLGNIREKKFKEIWFNSEVFKTLRNFETLKGKCGACGYRNICGGCRARAYGLSSDFVDFCGDLHEPTELKGDYLAEDPLCIYKPENTT